MFCAQFARNKAWKEQEQHVLRKTKRAAPAPSQARTVTRSRLDRATYIVAAHPERRTTVTDRRYNTMRDHLCCSV